MALSNTQYNTIMRVYEQKQTKNRHVREDRLQYVYANVKGYRLLDESVATLSDSKSAGMYPFSRT